MNLIDNWKAVVSKSWSFRLMIASAALGAAELSLPLFNGVFPQKMFATASDALRGQGIPGIRYLDGGSRGAGQGSSNFVVFPGNEDILKILERNGQPVGGLLGR